MEFKKGDKVRTKVSKHGIPKGIIDEIVDYKSKGGYLLKGWAGRFLASELELESSTPKFKVGDKVKIVVGCEYEHQGKKDGVFLEGEISRISPNSFLPYLVKWSNGKENSYGSDHLQLYTPEKILSKFKVGDIVIPVGGKQIGYNDDGTKRDYYDLSLERRIDEVKGDMIRLDGDYGIWFKPESWKLKEETPSTDFPTDWYIVWKNENIFNAVNKWSGKNWGYVKNALLTSDNIYHGNENFVETSKYKEITFEQFKKHVLKEKVEEPVKETVKPKFEEGKIYFHEFKGGSSYIFKCSKTGDYIESHKGRIHVDGSSFSSGSYSNSIGHSFREATPKEQKWFNVCSSMDTFVSMRELDKFNDDGTPNISPSKIPSNWCLKVTDENIESIGYWRTSGPIGSKDKGWVSHEGFGGCRGYWTEEQPKGLIEITTEQFFKHVLKKPYFGELDHPTPSIYTSSVDAGFYIWAQAMFTDMVLKCYEDEDPTNKYQVIEQQDAIILNRGTKKKKIFVI